METRNAYIMFTDIKGFSKLTDDEYGKFYSKVLKDLSEEIIQYKDKSLVWNTWGDALVAIMENKNDMIDLLFKYRDFFKSYDFDSIGLPKLSPRIAAHFGQFHFYDDPLINAKNAIGGNINTAARIEPITRINEIFVTQEFKNSIEAYPNLERKDIEFIEIGEVPLAKNFGNRNIYRLIKNNEEKKIIDRIIKQNLTSVLPLPKEMNEDELKNIESLKNSPNQDIFLSSLNIFSSENLNYLFEIAKLCKNFGLYNEALEFIKKIENQKQNVDGIDLILCKYNIQLMKLKANCLTRIGEYEEASNIIYGVWQLNNKDSDTLSMLAAQYKRRALIDKDGNFLDKAKINLDLLKRALNLYIEAFRLNIDDYYPAINIAYLYKIIGGEEAGKGIKLANYIQKTWNDNYNQDWWLAITLLECDIIQNDLEDIGNKLENLLNQYKPSYFERRSVYEQINLYIEFAPIDDSSKKIIIEEILNKLEV